MNTLIFLGGMGTGAVITTLLFLFLIHVLLRTKSKSDKSTIETNAASIRELKHRNEIGYEQIDALRKIAAALDPKTSGTSVLKP